MASRSRLPRISAFAVTTALSAALVLGGARLAAAGDGSVRPAGALARQAQLQTKVDSTLRARLSAAGRQVALRALAAPGKSVEEHAREVAGTLGSVANVDLQSLVFLVLMETSKALEEDLRAVISEVKALDAIKACKGAKRCIAALKATPELSQASLDAMREKTDKLESLSELSEMQQLRLQMVMDRKSKADEALSNILKKTAETSDSIIGNLK